MPGWGNPGRIVTKVPHNIGYADFFVTCPLDDA
jgi:hypothetical protein